MTTKVRSRQELERRIAELKERLENPPIFPTEVYTRIVGYYRSVAAWNKGKREEYDHRKMFRVEPGQLVPEESPRSRRATSYLFFFRQTCPACPAMKAKLDTLDLEGRRLDVDSPEGLEAAVVHQVMATPTVILVDREGREVTRVTDVRDWDQVQKAVAPV